MPRYFFALDDDLPLSEAAEELANDDIASNVATVIAGELSRNRHGRDQVAVSVFNENGKVVHKIWTRSEYDSARTIRCAGTDNGTRSDLLRATPSGRPVSCRESRFADLERKHAERYNGSPAGGSN
jgi:hypothetical protein